VQREKPPRRKAVAAYVLVDVFIPCDPTPGGPSSRSSARDRTHVSRGIAALPFGRYNAALSGGGSLVARSRTEP